MGELVRINRGKVLRDTLLLLVILGLGLPYLVSNVGNVSLSLSEEAAASAARREVYQREQWLANSLTHKVVETTEVAGGIRFRESYYTIFGLPWGWSEATVAPGLQVTEVKSSLVLGDLF